MMIGHWHGAGILRRSDLMLDEKEFGRAFDWPVYRRLFGFVRPYAGPMALSALLTLVYTSPTQTRRALGRDSKSRLPRP